MFDLDAFVDECKRAVEGDPTHKAIAELTKRALSDTSALIDALGEPEGPALVPLYQSEKLTILSQPVSQGCRNPEARWRPGTPCTEKRPV